MSDFIFLNVYSGSSPNDKDNFGELFLWNVYLNEKENIYLIQKLDENNNPTAEKYKISPTFFGVNFRKINDVQLETKTKKNIIFIRSKNKTDKTDDLLKANSSVSSSVKSGMTDKKKTGEFLIQLSANKPQAIQKKSEDAPKSNLSVKKTTNEFQLGVSPAPQKTANVNDFGLSSLLNTFTQANKKGNQKPTLTISAQNINSPKTAAPAAPETNDTPKAPAAANSAPVQTEQNSQPLQTARTVPGAQHIGNVINVKTPDTAQQQIEESAQSRNTPSSSAVSTPKQPAETKPAETQFADTAKESGQKDRITGTDEALLQPKAVEKEYQLSEKALKLDMSIRAEFQVSLTHWNSAKKNLAKRHFYDILTRPGNYVPAHKHMFTDFAIKLRKINLQDLALQFATKSTTLSPDDSHAFFNVARLYYELGRYEEAEGFIDKAIELENDLSPALRLSNIIKECIRRKAQNK